MKILDKLALWFQKTRFYDFLLIKIFPYLTFRIWGYPTFPIAEYFSIRAIMRKNPDQFYVFTGTDRSFLSWKIRKLLEKSVKWSHAGAMFLDEDGEIQIVDMTSKNKMVHSALDYLKEVDDFRVGKIPLPPGSYQKYKKRLVNLCSSKVKAVYDYDLDLSPAVSVALDNDQEIETDIYCSEEVYILGFGLVTDARCKAHFQFGKEYFEPDDVADASEEVFLYDKG